MLLGMLRLSPSLSWRESSGIRFWIDAFTEKHPGGSKGLKVMGSGGLCEVNISFCCSGSTREGGNEKRKIDM